MISGQLMTVTTSELCQQYSTAAAAAADDDDDDNENGDSIAYIFAMITAIHRKYTVSERKKKKRHT